MESYLKDFQGGEWDKVYKVLSKWGEEGSWSGTRQEYSLNAYVSFPLIQSDFALYFIWAHEASAADTVHPTLQMRNH